MNNLFFSKPYIDATIEQIKSLLDLECLVTDSTYANDQCASIQILSEGQTFLLFLPNSFIENWYEEKYIHYSLMADEDYATGKDHSNYPNLEDAICRINCALLTA
jgi:hypothetical protein